MGCCNAIIKLSDRIKIFVEVYGHRENLYHD